MDKNHLKHIQTLFDDAIAQKKMAGVNLLIYKDGKETGYFESGYADLKENRRYEMLSGHRRKKALELIGATEAICNIEDLLDEEATILMVDSNIYREKIFPSEKAFAYKMKLEAIKYQGKKKPLLHNLCRS